MKVVDKILNKILNKNKSKLDFEIDDKLFSDIDIISEFDGIYPLQWLFTYNDGIRNIYVYILKDTPYLYAKIFLSPVFNSYVIQLFSYIGDDLNKDNIDNVDGFKLQYTLSPTDIKVLGPCNQYGFTYESLIKKLIEQYFIKLDAIHRS